MDINKMLTELKTQKFLVDQAIFALERLAIGGKKRRGRPPNFMRVNPTFQTPELPVRMKHRHPFTKKTRLKMAAAQKKRWAAKKAKNV